VLFRKRGETNNTLDEKIAKKKIKNEFCKIKKLMIKDSLYEFSFAGFERSNLFYINEIENEIASHEKLCKIPRNDKIGILQNP
jgi:tRNA A37 threonylcarbamoyltransferase TsaD